uniref:Histone deacetylase n=1 Tax=Stichopus japonicus TaxID=307972 RepID=A0A1B2LQQ6_STIJA|nr:histone deacetylase 4/7 [Apostichopus japonicus]
MSKQRVDASPTEASDNIQGVEDHFNSMHLKEDPLAGGLPPSGVFPSGNRVHLMEDPAWTIHQDLLRLQQQQQFQQQLLMAQYKQRQDQMASQHMKQQQELLLLKREQMLEQQAAQQRQLELQQREQQEKQQLQQLLAKKDKPSANASTQVKDKLQRFLLNRKHGQDMTGGGPLNHSPPRAFRHWTPSVSLDHHSPPHVSSAYQQPPFGQYDNFPLRKTASDSNLKVRSRLKEKVTERRSHGSPLLRRREGQGSLKKKPWSGDFDSSLSSSAPGSGPSSPSSGGASSGDNGIHMPGQVPEEASSSYHMRVKTLYGTGSSNDNLYSSPSLPNISLGLPPASSQHSPPLAAAKPGITGSIHHGAPLFPTAYLPSVPVSLGSAIPHTMLAALPIQEINSISGIPPGSAQRLVRPLARTHSAPLPTSQQASAALHSSQHLMSNPHLMDAHTQQLLLLQQQRLLESEEQVDERDEESLSQKERSVSSLKDLRHIKQEPVDLTEDAEEEERCRLRDREEFYMKHTSLPPSVRLNDTGALASSDLAHRTLKRAQSSPTPNTANDGSQQGKFTTGLAYDTMMLKHQCICNNNANHPEHPGRLQSIWARLQGTGLVSRCEKIKVRKATFEELQSCHSEGYVLFFGTSQPNRSKIDPKKLACMPKRNFTWLPCGGFGVDTDTIWNDLHSPSAVRMAAGAVIELAFKVAAGELKNGLAIVRPPGHHAETSQAMGFCFFNSIAIAAKQLRTKLKLNKILIVDWDVHHGNSTQKIFYEDQHVLYISLHRHDDGNFFPGTGAPDECGCGSGLGYNVNIAWHGGLDPAMGDAEYMAAFRTVVLPIAKEFSPDVVLVSAGFDAAVGHPAPLGGYQVSPQCFGYMTKQLLSLAGGRVVLVLEGGYDLQSICDSSEVCTQVLLGEEAPKVSEKELDAMPIEKAAQCLEKTIKIQSEYWTSVRTTLSLIRCSERGSQRQKLMESEAVDAMASLSVATSNPSLNETSEPMEDVITEEPKEDNTQ